MKKFLFAVLFAMVFSFNVAHGQDVRAVGLSGAASGGVSSDYALGVFAEYGKDVTFGKSKFNFVGLAKYEFEPKDDVSNNRSFRLRPEARYFIPYEYKKFVPFVGIGANYVHQRNNTWSKSGFNLLPQVGARYDENYIFRVQRVVRDRTNLNDNALRGTIYGADGTFPLDSKLGIRASLELTRFAFDQKFAEKESIVTRKQTGWSLGYRIGIEF